MKIATVVGARPQFIKTAPVSAQFDKFGIEEFLIHTGQHFDENMSKSFFDDMNLRQPAYNLNINNLPHGALTGRMMEELEKIFLSEKPDWVFVYGDTDSTLAGALAAKKLNLRLAHIEAGLRSFNMMMPEEINRIVTDRISDILFCPAQNAVDNLLKEGIDKSKIVINGDVMKDTMLFFAEKARKPNVPLPEKFVLCTLHRAENINNIENLNNIIAALDEISSQIPVILPLHPHTKNRIKECGIKIENLNIIDPVGYLEMLFLLQNCSIVLTDSGGLQKEAFYAGKYCITMRNETEWTELVELGCNILTGSDKEKIIAATFKNISKSVNTVSDIYGTGNAAEMIAKSIRFI